MEILSNVFEGAEKDNKQTLPDIKKTFFLVGGKVAIKVKILLINMHQFAGGNHVSP